MRSLVVGPKSSRPLVRSMLGSSIVFASTCLVLTCGSPLQAGITGGTTGVFGRAVGGVRVNPDGALAKVEVIDRNTMRDLLAKEVDGPEAAAVAPVKMRMVSLKAIEKALSEGGANLETLPDEIKYLAGLQRIQYVFADPDNHDIILAGPAEGWKVGPSGDVVGLTTNQPVVMLADLVVALQTVEAARTEGLTCSIDPTAEGRKNLDILFARTRMFSPELLPAVQSALGPQAITLTGVPEDSHLARVLVAADYHLKRISMGIDPSPVKGIPNFLELVSRSGRTPTNMMPRWWMACAYEPLVMSADGLSWEIKGPGVKVLTEDELISKDGKVTGTGRTSKIAENLATAFNTNMETLSAREPVFGGLRNVMDLCVVAALLDKHGLFKKVGLSTPTMLGKSGDGVFRSYPAPKTVGTEVSFVAIGGQTVITASGGVDINSWAVVDQTPTTADMTAVRGQAVGNTSSLWWNPVTR